MKFRICFILFLISFLVIIFCSRSKKVKSIDGAKCKRTCSKGDSRICHYKFVLEFYQSMGNFCGSCSHSNYSTCFQKDCILGDFRQKGVMSINRQIPGPDIQVCQGDRIVIDVINQAPGTAAALHWHGLHMREAPFMDGVPFITQCPIMFGTAFRYDFPATEVGTFFYHSHSGLHKMNGQHGAFIIRGPKDSDTHKGLYDYDDFEHYIILSDWVHGYAEDYFPGFGTTILNGILINGISHNLTTSSGIVKTFSVERNKKHRFRLIDSVGFGCSVQVQIQDHKMLIIAADGVDVLPKEVDIIHINSGERFDFVLDANNKHNSEFWIRVRADGNCELFPESYALLRYTNGIQEVDYHNLPPVGLFLSEDMEINNPGTVGKGNSKDISITELVNVKVNRSVLEAEPDYKFIMSIDDVLVPESAGSYHNFFVRLGNVATYGAFNNISFAEQHFPLLTQSEEIRKGTFCDDRNLPDNCHGKEYCFCTHRLKVKLNSIVQITLLGTENGNFMNHPIHLHGSHFYITGIGSDATKISYEPQSENPPYKDTLSVPGSGYAIIRFKADNPGFWFFHCHYDYHHAAGMSAVFQVGELEEMNKGPKDFPKCGNYLPDIEYV